MVDVSIIVPAYNSELTLSRCVDSLIHQSYSEIEIIIVDDGSKDNTRTIVEKLQKDSDKLIYSYQENAGVSEARNAGLKIANGKWIVFCDSDDYVENNYVELLVESKKKYNCDWVIAGFKKRIGTEEYIFDNPYADETVCSNLEAFASVWYKNPYIAGVCGALYDAVLIKSNKLVFPKGMHHGEDTVFNINYFYYCKNVSFVHEPIYVYMDQENSLTSIYREDIWENQTEILKQFSNLCLKKGFLKKAEELFLIRCITLSLNNTASHKCNKQIWRKLCKKIRDNEKFNKMNLTYKEMDTFGAIVICLLKNNQVWLLFQLFKIKMFIYSKMKGLYFTFRR